MAKFILVHGAWHGAWCWEKIVPLLEKAGHQVWAHNLPGHGKIPRLPWSVSMNSYIRSTSRRVLRRIDTPAILVGHSMGGMVITGVAERHPEKVRACIYLCAFLPPSGKSLGDLAPDVSPIAPTDSKMNFLTGGIRFTPERAASVFYNDCTPQDAAAATQRLCPQPARAFGGAVHWTPYRFGSVDKFAIRCEKDRAIYPESQEAMARAGGVKEVFSLDSDHSPFFSKPEALADILCEIAER